MTQSTLVKQTPETVLNPHEDPDAHDTANPRYLLTIDESVVEKVASLAAQKVNGIIDMKGNVFSLIQESFGGNDQRKGVDADVVDDESATVELSVILEYGKSATEVFEELKKVIIDDIKKMTGLTVTDMTVNIVDVMDKEEFDQKRSNLMGTSNSNEAAMPAELS